MKSTSMNYLKGRKNMKSILIKLGYYGEIFNYVTKKICGIWFSFIGTIIIIATIFGYKLCMNPFIFGIGYSIGFYLCYGNKKYVFNRLASGVETSFQKKMSDNALLILSILCGVFGGICWLTHQSIRNIWLSLLIATAIHFFAFYFVHGKSVVILGILCLLYGALGFIFPTISFIYIAFLDGITKIIIGVVMFFQKPSNNENSFYRKLFSL